MEVHQFAHVVDHMVVEAQRLEALARHLGAHGVVVVEADLAARFETARLRLADVMHQRGEAQRQVRRRHGSVGAGFERHRAVDHNHRVLEHVFVAVVFVDLELQRGNLGTMADRLGIVSAERVRDELVKLLLSDRPRAGIEAFVDSGLADVVFPEIPALQLEIDERRGRRTRGRARATPSRSR